MLELTRIAILINITIVVSVDNKVWKACIDELTKSN